MKEEELPPFNFPIEDKTQRLHEYIQKGVTMDDERLKQGGFPYKIICGNHLRNECTNSFYKVGFIR